MDLKKKIIKNIKKKNKAISINKFISLSLFENNSYYKSKLPIGSYGDFITSPEISQMFGEIIGAYILNYWTKYIGSKFNLIELGPGKGSLMEDILRVTKLDDRFIKSANIKLIEKNRNLIELQKNKIKLLKIKNVKWLSDFKIDTKLPSIIYSNEFFDCLPVRLFHKQKSWKEKTVDFNQKDKIFFLKDEKVREKKIIEYLEINNHSKIAEISFDRIKYFNKICNFIYKNKGLIITIDYGYQKPLKNFTLQAISSHNKSHIFDNIGRQDISSYVNFKELIDIAKKNNLKILSFSTQKNFLISNGIIERKKILMKNLPHEKKIIIQNQFNRLTMNDKMGKDFKFLIISS